MTSVTQRCIALAFFGAFAFAGCGGARGTVASSAGAHTRPTLERAVATVLRAAHRPALDAVGTESVGRRPGEFVVFRFSGAYRKLPAVLTERVVAEQGTDLLVDYALVEQPVRDRSRGERARALRNPRGVTPTKTESLRVRYDLDTPRGEVREVLRSTPQGLERADRATLDALIAQTVAKADENLETLEREPTDCQAFGETLACERSRYRVRVGGRTGTMTLVRSDRFAWGDLSAEIRLDDGTVLYRAELVDSGYDGAS